MSHAGASSLARRTSASSAPEPSGAKQIDRPAGREPIAASHASASRASQSARSTAARSATYASSRARSSGIVHTATPPARSTANQHAACIGVLGARSSTRFPGTSPSASTSTRATRRLVSATRA